MFRFSFVPFFLVVITPVYTVAAPDISQLLSECNQHLKANRLTSGKGGSALSCYQKVLKMEPTNAKALAGLNKIEARYVKWAKRALQKDQKDKAKQYLANLRLVNPQLPVLAELEAQLQPSDKPVATKSPVKSVIPSSADKSVALRPSTDESATPSSINEELPPPRKAQITDIGQIYELINTTECLTWPTPEMKKMGGKNSWGKFYPKKGDTGMIIKEMQHCHLEDNVFIVELEQYYVPINSVGVKIMDEKEQQASD